MSDDLTKRLREVSWDDDIAGVCIEGADRIAALEAQLAEAVEALEPFAECCDEALAKFQLHIRLNINDFRRASATLARLKEERHD